MPSTEKLNIAPAGNKIRNRSTLKMSRRSIMRRTSHRLIVALLFMGSICCAQVPPHPPDPAHISFSVVSIRPNKTDERGYFWPTQDGLILKNNSVFELLQTAFGTETVAPAWTRNERYDVVAKVDESDLPAYKSMSPAQQVSLLQPVMIDRFALKLHTEQHTFKKLALVVDNAQKTSTALIPSKDQQAKYPNWLISGHYQLDAKSGTMHDLCNMLLSTEAQEAVVDQTGLNGKYDFRLSWSRVFPEPSATAPPDSGDAPDIFHAVKEQLGLKMVPTHTVDTVYVIDAISRPSLN